MGTTVSTSALAAAIQRALPQARPGLRTTLKPTMAAAVLALLSSSVAWANNYTVTANGDPGSGGLSLRQAVVLTNTVPGSTIDFDASLIGATITLTQGQIAIGTGVSIIGPGFDKLTIDGGGSTIFNADVAQASATPVTISGLTLRHAGYAIYANDISLVTQNCLITDNQVALVVQHRSVYPTYLRLENSTIQNSSGAGTAFFADASIQLGVANAQISSSTIRNNNATAIYAVGAQSRGKAGALTISGSNIYGNNASVDKHGAAGGINAVSLATVTITGTTIRGNTSAQSAGGIDLQTVRDVTINVSTITGNASNLGSGGGIRVDDERADADGPVSPYTHLAINDSAISGNYGSLYGGGIDIENAAGFAISRTLISGNRTGFDGIGGGIAVQSLTSTSQVANTTLYGNFGYEEGGAIALLSAAAARYMTITNATIVGNTTQAYYGNGIWNNGGSQPLVIDSSIIANNASLANHQDLSGTFDVNYSLVKNPGNATIINVNSISGVDPQLGPLADNGGPTLSMLPATTSPVLDAGKPATVFLLDQRGLPRVAHGRDDMGAVERQYPEDLIFRNGFDSL